MCTPQARAVFSRMPYDVAMEISRTRRPNWDVQIAHGALQWDLHGDVAMEINRGAVPICCPFQ